MCAQCSLVKSKQRIINSHLLRAYDVFHWILGARLNSSIGQNSITWSRLTAGEVRKCNLNEWENEMGSTNTQDHLCHHLLVTASSNQTSISFSFNTQSTHALSPRDNFKIYPVTNVDVIPFGSATYEQKRNVTSPLSTLQSSSGDISHSEKRKRQKVITGSQRSRHPAGHVL